MYTAKKVVSGNFECYHRNCCFRMPVQFSSSPHCVWGVEWPASWSWQYDTPVQYAVIPSRQLGQLFV